MFDKEETTTETLSWLSENSFRAAERGDLLSFIPQSLNPNSRAASLMACTTYEDIEKKILTLH